MSARDELVDVIAEAIWLANDYDLNADPGSSTDREMRPHFTEQAQAVLAALVERYGEPEVHTMRGVGMKFMGRTIVEFGGQPAQDFERLVFDWRPVA